MKIDIVPRPQKLEINLENKNILKFNLSPISIFQSKINFPEDSDSHWFWWFPVGICRYKRVVNHMTCYNFKCFHWQKIYLKKNPLQDLLSSLNAVISTNESTRIITGHVIYNPAYTYKFQLKTIIKNWLWNSDSSMYFLTIQHFGFWTILYPSLGNLTTHIAILQLLWPVWQKWSLAACHSCFLTEFFHPLTEYV